MSVLVIELPNPMPNHLRNKENVEADRLICLLRSEIPNQFEVDELVILVKTIKEICPNIWNIQPIV